MQAINEILFFSWQTMHFHDLVSLIILLLKKGEKGSFSRWLEKLHVNDV